MPILYNDLGSTKRLNEIVFVGTHDAGIDRGRQWTKTQKLSLYQQAVAGVRIFDLRVAAASVNGSKIVHRAYHGTVSKKSHQVNVGGVATPVVEYTMVGGNFGAQLGKMLLGARQFLTEQPTEFLLLKFDKCENYGLIANECKAILGTMLFDRSVNLNETVLFDLRGKAVVLFPPEHITGQTGGPTQGIHAWRSLASGGAYDPQSLGLQYYGKGGTDMATGYAKTKYSNIVKQGGLMQGMQANNTRGVLGMLYWTMTGVLGDIKGRNDKLWNDANVARLKTLWVQSLGQYTIDRLATPVYANSPALGPLLQNAIPNIIMIDFADNKNCKMIYDLNRMKYHEFAALAQNYTVLTAT